MESYQSTEAKIQANLAKDAERERKAIVRKEKADAKERDRLAKLADLGH